MEHSHASELTVDEGVYCVEDSRVVLGIDAFGDPPICGNFWSAAWDLDDDDLWFRDVVSHSGFDVLVEALFGSQAWQRIG